MLTPKEMFQNMVSLKNYQTDIIVFRNLLDKYILENFDIEGLKFDTETHIDINHVFGIHATHFVEDYYITKNQQLLKIIKNNRLGFYNEQTVQYREECRKELVKSF